MVASDENAFADRAVLPVSLSATGFEAKRRVLGALLRADVRTEFGRTGLGLLGNVAEPLADIGVLVLWHYSIRVLPIYGTSIILFVASGLFPVFIFIHLSSKFFAITKIRKEHFRGIESIDLMVSKAILTVSIYSIVGVLLFVALYIFITPQANPFRPMYVILAVASLISQGVGMAFANAVIGAMVPFWKFIWGGISRMFIIFGGILYVPDLLPDSLRQYIKWNPALQAVELFRQGFYPNFPVVIYMPLYLAATSIGLLCFGLCLQRSTRNIVMHFRLAEL